MVNITKNVLIMLNNPSRIQKNASKKAIKKTAETTGNFTDNKIADKILKVSRT